MRLTAHDGIHLHASSLYLPRVLSRVRFFFFHRLESRVYIPNSKHGKRIYQAAQALREWKRESDGRALCCVRSSGVAGFFFCTVTHKSHALFLLTCREK